MQGKTVLFQPLEIPMKLSHLIILLVMNLCWAGVYSAYKVMGPELASGGIVTLRFGLAGIFMLLAWPLYPLSEVRLMLLQMLADHGPPDRLREG